MFLCIPSKCCLLFLFTIVFEMPNLVLQILCYIHHNSVHSRCYLSNNIISTPVPQPALQSCCLLLTCSTYILSLSLFITFITYVHLLPSLQKNVIIDVNNRAGGSLLIEIFIQGSPISLLLSIYVLTLTVISE